MNPKEPFRVKLNKVCIYYEEKKKEIQSDVWDTIFEIYPTPKGTEIPPEQKPLNGYVCWI